MFLVLIAFLFLLPTKIYAQSITWNKYQNNPIITTDTNPRGPSVLKQDGIYKMWYTDTLDGIRSIQYATSSNGIDWQTVQTKIIVPDENEDPNWPETELYNPSVIFDGTTYKMWYVSSIQGSKKFSSGEARYRIQYATSSDGINWQRSGIALSPEQNTWEAEGIGSPMVIYNNSSFQIWYSGRDRFGIWRIGYATSSNGTSWSKHSSNPVIYPTETWEYVGQHMPGASAPSTIEKDSQYYLFYSVGQQVPATKIGYAVSGDGIKWEKKGVILELGESGSFDNKYIAAPSVIEVAGKLWLYYSGYNGSKWSIGLATESGATPGGKDAIVIVPGMFASYDAEAFKTCSKTSWQNWKLFPKVSEYNGLIKTLETAGYTRNSDLFIFPYDWRQKITNSGSDLKDFIRDEVVLNNPGKKIDLIGHSLGGLVARSFTQEYDANLVDQLITVGSPHHGVVEAYKPWAGGELAKEGFMRLAASFAIAICKARTASLTNKDAIQKAAPVFQELLPTSTYLKRAGTHLDIDYDGLPDNLKNPYLPQLNQGFASYFDSFSSLTSTSYQVAKVYGVSTYFEDKLLGIYTQGRPTTVLINGPGDERVLSESAIFTGATYYDLPFNHSGLIYSKNSIQKIVDVLGLAPTTIVPGQRTTLNKSLLLLLLSPATIEVKNPAGEIVATGEKFVFLPGYSEGEYEVTVTGTDSGDYELFVGQVTEETEQWENYKNTTVTGEKDVFLFNFDPDKPKKRALSDPKTQLSLPSAQQKLADLKKLDSSPLLAAVELYLQKKDPRFIARAIRYLVYFTQETSSIEARNKALDLIGNLETIYDSITQDSDKLYYKAKLANSLAYARLQRQERANKAASESAALLVDGADKLSRAVDLLNDKPHLSSILSHTAYYLFKYAR